MKIELGKLYQTRCGLPVRIYAIDNGGDCPVHGSYHEHGIWHGESWSEIGVWSCCYNGHIHASCETDGCVRWME